MFRSFVAGICAGGTFSAASQTVTGAGSRSFSTSITQSTKSVGPLTITTIPEFPTYFLATTNPSSPPNTLGKDSPPPKKEDNTSVLQQLVNKVWSASDATGITSNSAPAASNLHLDTVSNTTDTIYVLARVKADDELPAKASSGQQEAEQPCMNLSVALDISGSMHGSRLDEAKEALMFMIKQCTPKDYVSIALFESAATVALEPTQMDQRGQQRALDIVKEFQTAGCTNLSAGIEMALGLLKGQSSWLNRTMTSAMQGGASKDGTPVNGKKKQVNASLAFTDGYANEGICETSEICKFLSPKVEQANAALHTFGFGAHHNEDMLKRIAGIGSGSYYFIDSPEKMKEVFADCLGGVMSTVAQDIKLTIKPRPGFYVDQVFTSYKSTSDSKTPGAKTVTLRDLYRSEQRDVLIRLRRDDSHNNSPHTTDASGHSSSTTTTTTTTTPFVDVDLSYDSLCSGQREQGEVSCGANISQQQTCGGGAASTVEGSADIRDHKVRFAVLQGMDDSRQQASNGDMDKAKETLTSMRNAIWPPNRSAATETEKNLQKDVDNAITLMGRTYENYKMTGSKSMLQQMESHKSQRYAAQSYDGTNNESSWSSSWDTSAKAAMRSLANKKKSSS